MKIIQSFSQFDNGCQYANKVLKGSEVYLNFYSFLLSYLTLKKYYGFVTMYCNQKAYDTFIKFIPYDEVIIKENKHTSQQFWSAYKIDIIREQKESFIHVDSDVFIFDDLFDEYINNSDKYDVIIQNTITKNNNSSQKFIYDNLEILKKLDIYKIDDYNGECFSCGVIGMNLNVKEKYNNITEKLYDGLNNNIFNMSHGMGVIGMILEEQSLHLVCQQNNFRNYNILSYNNVVEFGEEKSGNLHKYTHMWFSTKFQKKYIDLIKNKIKTEFKQQYDIVETYDKHISQFNIKYL